MATKDTKKPTYKKSSYAPKKSSGSSYQSKAIKTAKKAVKKNPKAFFIVLLVILIVVGLGVAAWFLFLKDRVGGGSDPQTSSEPPSTSEPIITKDAISINFLELGNWYTGDSTFIKAGDVDILIDAGSRQGSSATIKEFVNQYCTDGKLEYVIATHAHQDHIAGFVGTKAAPGIFESYKIGILIDFALTDVTSQLYGNYVAKRDAALESGDIEHHYTAKDCIEGNNGAQKEYVINESTKMTVLDQKYYYEKSSDENNYSVCTLFTHGSNHYLFTGDLEKEGEASLVKKNTLPHCQLFKGGHHGSKTSNTEALLSKITPENVCICCCCGNDEYTDVDANQFPTQTAINNIAKYTDKIYVTTISLDNDKKTYASMNGIITFKCDDGINYVISGSNNSTILKETDWFKEHRTWPSDGV